MSWGLSGLGLEVVVHVSCNVCKLYHTCQPDLSMFLSPKQAQPRNRLPVLYAAGSSSLSNSCREAQ